MAQDRDDKLEAFEDLLGGDPRRFCAKWLEAITAAGDEEKTWREDHAEQALKAYRGDPSSNSTAFNIFHSNIETLVPALYNTTPIPDVRRRFNDDDPVAAQLSEMLERALSFCVDDYDFDDVMKRVVKDMAVVDRGIARVKYEPTMGTDASAPALEAGQDPAQVVEYEEAKAEYVMWRNFRRGPATTWDKVPWIAFRHGLSREEVQKLVQKSGFKDAVKAKVLGDITYNVSAEDSGEKGKESSRELPTFGKRTNAWEIWDKDTRKVIWISEDYRDYPLAVMDDPLELRGFYPTPRPAMIIETTDSLTPVTSYSIYAELIGELNDISSRIKALVGQLRVRGAYAGMIDQIPQIAQADDGEMIPLADSEIFATTGGGLEKAIVWWPIDMIVTVLKELVVQRDIVKSVIYEVTGLADIIRGSTDPNETATAQQIKQQWGSIRVQSHQKEVERYAADLFRLKAEIFCKHFDIQTLLMITGLQYPSRADQERARQLMQQGEEMMAQAQQMQAAMQSGQIPPEQAQAMQAQMQQMQQMAPQIEAAKKQIDEILGKPALEDIQELMQNDRVLKYRVDVESDSTVRADLTKNQEQLKGFLEGTASYGQSIGPLVQQGAMDGAVAVEIFAAFARNFRLGKQAEDALDKWADTIRKNGMQGKEDPVAQADANLKMAQAEKAKAEAGKVQTETQLMPAQFKATVAKDRAAIDMQARKSAADDEDRKFNRVETAKANRAKHSLEVGKARQADRHHGDQMAETKAGRQQSMKMERMKMADGVSARREAALIQAHNEGKEPPSFMGVPEGQEPQASEQAEYLTDEEKGRMDKSDQILEAIATGLQGMAQAQAQSTQMLASAIEGLAKGLTAPKELVRDASGRPVGVKTSKA